MKIKRSLSREDGMKMTTANIMAVVSKVRYYQAISLF